MKIESLVLYSSAATVLVWDPNVIKARRVLRSSQTYELLFIVYGDRVRTAAGVAAFRVDGNWLLGEQNQRLYRVERDTVYTPTGSEIMYFANE